MAKKLGKSKAGVIPAVAPQGKKIVFDAEPVLKSDDSEEDQQSLASREDTEEHMPSDGGSDEETDGDDDDAPEAVGFAVDQRKAQAEADAESA